MVNYANCSRKLETEIEAVVEINNQHRITAQRHAWQTSFCRSKFVV